MKHTGSRCSMHVPATGYLTCLTECYMKHLRIFLSLALLLSAGMSRAQNTSIDLDISGVDEGTVFSLEVDATHHDETPITTAQLRNGKLYFAFDADGPRIYAVKSQNPFGFIQVAVAKGDHAKIYAVGTKVNGPRGPYYNFAPVQVKGSSLQSELESKLSVRGNLDKLYTQYHTDHQAFLDSLSATERGSGAFKTLMDSEEGRAYQADEKKFFDTVQDTYHNLYLQNKNSWWGPALVLVTMNWIPKETADIYDQFSDEAKQSYYGRILADLITPPSENGRLLPDFRFVDHATGQQTSLSAQLQGKKYLLLDFWASWCAPCRKEIPNFKSQYERYHEKGFGIVSISADEKEADWLKALDEEQLPWANGRDTDKSIQKLYDVRYYPTVYVIDSEGKVVAKDEECRGEKLQTLLERLFP